MPHGPWRSGRVGQVCELGQDVGGEFPDILAEPDHDLIEQVRVVDHHREALAVKHCPGCRRGGPAAVELAEDMERRS